jgi:hypothetical protein
MDSKKIMIYGGVAVVLIIIVVVVLMKKEKFTSAQPSQGLQAISSNLPPQVIQSQLVPNGVVINRAGVIGLPTLSAQEYHDMIGPKISAVRLYLSSDALALLDQPINAVRLLNSVNNFQLMTSPSLAFVTLKAGLPASVDQQFNGYIEFSPAPQYGISETVGVPFGKILEYTYSDMEGVYRTIQNTGIIVGGGVPISVDLQSMDESALGVSGSSMH